MTGSHSKQKADRSHDTQGKSDGFANRACDVSAACQKTTLGQTSRQHLDELRYSPCDIRIGGRRGRRAGQSALVRSSNGWEPWHMRPIPSHLALNGADGRERRRVRSLSLKDGKQKRRGSGTLSSIEITRTSISRVLPVCSRGMRWVSRTGKR